MISQASYNSESDEFSSICTSSSSSSSDESSNEEFLAVLNAAKNIPAAYTRRKITPRENNFEKYDEDEFEMRFRLTKDMTVQLTNQIYKEEKQNIKSRATSGTLKPLEKVLIAFRYFASGSFQIVNADLFSVNQSTVSRIVKEVSTKIAYLAKININIPTNKEEIDCIKTGFYEMYSIPGIIGAIDCTHIPIQSPGGDKAENFRNRKGWFSINVQIVCDSNMKILDIVARWPGSCHDQMIFNFSQLQAEIENGKYGVSYLIGDSGYACKNYLLTPVPSPKSSKEVNFNNAFVSTRQVVERTIGVWKRRFPVLSLKSRLNVETTLVVITATAVIHNILKDRPVPTSDASVEELVQPEPLPLPAPPIADTSRRSLIISNFF